VIIRQCCLSYEGRGSLCCIRLSAEAGRRESAFGGFRQSGFGGFGKGIIETSLRRRSSKRTVYVNAFDYSGTRCRADKVSRRNHPCRRFVGDGCRNGSPSGLRDRAPGSEARRSRSGLYAARRTRPLRTPEIAMRQGPVVLVFYRGGWCPYCNLHLRGLQRALPEFQQFGAQIVAISPQLPDNSLSTQEKDELTFAVLSDVGNKVARRFGIVFQIGEKLQKLYRKFGHPLDLFNGSDGAEHLPVPGTFLVDGKGVIRLAHIDVDYTRRLDPDDVITTLRELTAWTKLGR
jgi:peroxiredoxin